MIKFFNYLKEYKKIEPEIIKEIKKTLSSGRLILSDSVEKFEDNFKKIINRKYAVGVNSGTDAIEIALRALNLPLHSEILTAANGPVPTIAAIRSAGYIPKFVDINKETLQIEIEQFENAITKKTKAAVIVQLYGNSVDMFKVKQICKKHKLKLIEDCAQSLGAKINDKITGSFSDISCFSFYPTKNLGAYGDAGICLTDNKKLYDRIKKIRMYGYNKNSISVIEGINSRMDSIQAGILNVKLKYLKTNLEKRKKIAEIYNENIKNKKIQKMQIENNIECSYHLYVIKTKKRDLLQKYLLKKDVQALIHYASPIHLMPAYKFLGYKKNDLKNTETVCKEVLSLPCYPELSIKDVYKICNIINEF